MSRGSAIWDLTKVCIGEPKLVAAISAASQREVVQHIPGLSDVDKFDIALFDKTSQATEASLMLILTTEWFLDVGLVVLGGDHLQLLPVIESKCESRVGNILNISPLERSVKFYHYRPLASLVREYSRVQIYRLALAVRSRMNSDSTA